MNNSNNPFEHGGSSSSSDNPFEIGNKKSTNKQFETRKKKNSFESSSASSTTTNNGNANKQTTPKSNNEIPKAKRKNRKSYKNKLIWWIIILVVVPWIWNSNDYSYDFKDDLDTVASLETVENYTYDFKDVNTEATVNPFPKQLLKGKSYTFDHSDKRLVSTTDGETINLVVGRDIEPGVYTIKTTGRVQLNTDLAVDNYFNYHRGVNYYNVPLMEGDTLDVEYFKLINDTPGSVNITAQDKYVDYKPGLDGVFVYGLNQFDSEVAFDADSYGSILYGFNSPDTNRYTQEYFYDQDLALPGSPGSYFAVENKYEY